MTTKTTFQRAREENRMRAAIVNAPKLGAQGLTPAEVASLMQRGCIQPPKEPPMTEKEIDRVLLARSKAEWRAKNRAKFNALQKKYMSQRRNRVSP